jgi:hypothetical protein
MKEKEYEIILYVSDQERSKLFYQTILQKEPILDVPGMTEFALNNYLKLGLMPEAGIMKLLENKIPDPKSGNGIPRCELYILGEAEQLFQRAIDAGAKEISKLQPRDWGDTVGYVMDPDGHIIAFAKKPDSGG